MGHTTAKHYKVFDFNVMAHSEAMDIQAQRFSEHEEMQKNPAMMYELRGSLKRTQKALICTEIHKDSSESH